ncbi:MAG: AAA family ATPase [candidate division KSB1 bacterium]
MTTVVFFNNKGGVGKTSLVYHLAWMYAEHGLKVIAADLDPQANLTSMFLEEEILEKLWPEGEHPQSILGAIKPIIKGVGDIAAPHIEEVSENIGLVVGDLGLSTFEDKLSDAWPRCLDRDEAAFRIISAFYRILVHVALARNANVILIDVGPNLGAINRAAIIAAKYVVVPLAPDLFSLQGLRNLGPSLRRWREEWRERLQKNPEPNLILPEVGMQPLGYVIQQQAIRMDRPAKFYGRWMARVPAEYRESVLAQAPQAAPTVEQDHECLALLRHYRSLMPMAMEARKPIFLLKPADGAIGSHAQAVQDCYRDFKLLANKIAERCGVCIN